MRPKKVILLIDKDEDRRGITRFILANSCFEVHAVQSPDLDMGKLPRVPDCVLAFWPVDAAAAEKLARSAFAQLVVVKGPRVVLPWSVPAVVVLSTASTAELVGQLRGCCARKRGPRRKAQTSAATACPVGKAAA